MHEFYQRKFIYPENDFKEKYFENKNSTTEEQNNNIDDNKEQVNNNTNKKKKKGPQYEGGLVLEPAAGLYTNIVLLLDYNSLYPSIIQEYNLCFTTVERNEKMENEIGKIPSNDADKGVLPIVLKNLVEKRKLVRNNLKNEKDHIK